MDAFSEQLATVGYQGISLVGVAKTAGIRKPSIYHHFPGGKDELYAAVALRFIAHLRGRIDRTLRRADGVEGKLLALGVAVGDDVARTITFEQRIYDALEHVAGDTKTLVSDRYVEEILKPVEALFSTAVDEGELVGDPWFLMNVFLHLVRSAEDPGDRATVKRLVSFFFDGARPR